MLFLLPALFAIALLGIQGALYYRAHTVAMASAQEGARAAAAWRSGLDAGIAAASGFADDVGRDALSNVEITGSVGADVARITVSGRSTSLIPGWEPVVEASAAAPIEEVSAP